MQADQAMWAQQTMFRHSIESAAAVSFAAIGVTVAPTALLVGFGEGGSDQMVAVESAGLSVAPENLGAVLQDGDEAYETHPNNGIWQTDARLHEQFHAGLRDRCRADTLEKTLGELESLKDRRWFVGASDVVGTLRVYPVVGVLRERWDSLPALTKHEADHRTIMHPSLHDALRFELLRAATFALTLSSSPSGLRWDDREELVRRALAKFIREFIYFKGDFMGGEVHHAMNLVSAQPYEGRTGVGTMLLAADGDYTLALTFDEPIELSKTRALRKALEMTGGDLCLVTDGRVATGLGSLRADYKSGEESAFLLRVVGRGSWELVHDQTPLLEVTDGEPSIPRARLSREKFNDAVDRLFGSAGNKDRLWSLAIAASRQAHGTMLVIHADARSEADRLSPPAMSVAREALTESTLLAVSAIDGAILVDPSGHCHAVGAILDGTASSDLGDASRGARFNSAHRYLADARVACLIVIISEDGMLNLIPDLPRLVKRSYIDDVLQQVEALAHATPLNFELFHKREGHLRSLEFYLDSPQCARANTARELVESRRAEAASARGGGIARVHYRPYRPDPALTSEHFIDEGAQ